MIRYKSVLLEKSCQNLKGRFGVKEGKVLRFTRIAFNNDICISYLLVLVCQCLNVSTSTVAESQPGCCSVAAPLCPELPSMKSGGEYWPLIGQDFTRDLITGL